MQLCRKQAFLALLRRWLAPHCNAWDCVPFVPQDLERRISIHVNHVDLGQYEVKWAPAPLRFFGCLDQSSTIIGTLGGTPGTECHECSIEATLGYTNVE